MLATIDGASLIARTAVDTPKNILKTRALIEKSFRYQIDGMGFSLIEILSPCPTDWGLSPEESLHWMQEQLMPVFPLGVLRDRSAAHG
ncbi:MAG: hypothetical protein F9K51_08770 [Candidatus Dadabacteria bacterium]|nr:MAG: hypothetical protein F9K51_08770 [Candidatus Dadabacteria bacterium]